ncbi:MAG TPA: CPBP family intramembrane glutamic endopeptidase [Terriglobales bacterium]|nr:CPBP family intramembrane glutamic endopeptidase [Terriglobales bacterium]
MSSIPDPSLEPRAAEAIPPAPVVPAEDPPWGLVDVVLIAIFSVIATGLLTAVGFGIVHAIPAWRRYSVGQLAAEPLAVIPPQAVGYLFTLFFMVLVVRRGTAVPFWSAVKWKWPARLLPYFAAGLGLSILIQVGSAFLPIPKTLPIDEFFKTTHAAWILAVFGVLVAPLFEELFFRGFLYPVLYRRTGFFAAMVVNSLLFAFTHEGQLAHAWAPLLVLFVVGMVLTYVRARTQSVANSFLVHSGYNAFLFAMIFVATAGFRHMERLR